PPPPSQGAVWRRGKPRVRRHAHPHATKAVPAPRRCKEVAASRQSTVRVRFSRGRGAAVRRCPPAVIRCWTLRRHNGGTTLQAQDHHAGLRALPRKAMECEKCYSLSLIAGQAALLHKLDLL